MTTLDEEALRPCKFQKTSSMNSDTESVCTVGCDEEFGLNQASKPCNAKLSQSEQGDSNLGVVILPEMHVDQQVKAAVGDILQLLLQGTAPPASVSPALFSALAAKLTAVLDAAEHDSMTSLNNGANLAVTQLLPKILKLTEENQQLKEAASQAEQLRHQLCERERAVHAKEFELLGKEMELATQIEHTECYRDMSQTYQTMYLRAADVARSLQSCTPPSTTHRGRESPDWLDKAMEVPVVRSSDLMAPPRLDHLQARGEDEDEDDEEDEDAIDLTNEADVVQIMMKKDLRKYGAERTSQRWACHRFIFHHLALQDADIFPSIDDGRMYS